MATISFKSSNDTISPDALVIAGSWMNAHQAGRAWADVQAGVVKLVENHDKCALVETHGGNQTLVRPVGRVGLCVKFRVEQRLDPESRTFSEHPRMRSLRNTARGAGDNVNLAISKHVVIAALLRERDVVLLGDESQVAAYYKGIDQENAWLAKERSL